MLLSGPAEKSFLRLGIHGCLTYCSGTAKALSNTAAVLRAMVCNHAQYRFAYCRSNPVHGILICRLLWPPYCPNWRYCKNAAYLTVAHKSGVACFAPAERIALPRVFRCLAGNWLLQRSSRNAFANAFPLLSTPRFRALSIFSIAFKCTRKWPKMCFWREARTESEA